MGVLFDYFRAPDPSMVADLMDRTGGGPVPDSPGWTPDVVDAKAIDPDVVLGQLVAMAQGIDWQPNLVGTDLVWPAPEVAQANYDGPWTMVLADRARDVLAGIPEAQGPELAARWVQIEELAGTHDPHDAFVSLLHDLVRLARRAAEQGEHLYCWISL
jgi:hypothetical protein